LRKSAFTMIELIFVIVVVGIITVMVIPRLDRDTRFEAATQVLNHIKYTQHLAMTDDVYNHVPINNPTWWFARWQIEFYACGGYSIHSNANLTAGAPAAVAAPNAANNEAALDPQTREFLWVGPGAAGVCAAHIPGNFEKMDLSVFYDVSGFNTSAGCSTPAVAGNAASISFDNLGRPYSATTINGVMKQNCDITLTFNTGANEIVRIHPETGYACILTGAGGNCI